MCFSKVRVKGGGELVLRHAQWLWWQQVLLTKRESAITTFR